MARVQIHNQVPDGDIGKGWVLCFQQCTYHYEEDKDAPPERGYRFIWRRPGGNLQPARGQARIPDAETLYELLDAAAKAGWFPRPDGKRTKLRTT